MSSGADAELIFGGGSSDTVALSTNAPSVAALPLPARRESGQCEAEGPAKPVTEPPGCSATEESVQSAPSVSKTRVPALFPPRHPHGLVDGQLYVDVGPYHQYPISPRELNGRIADLSSPSFYRNATYSEPPPECRPPTQGKRWWRVGRGLEDPANNSEGTSAETPGGRVRDEEIQVYHVPRLPWKHWWNPVRVYRHYRGLPRVAFLLALFALVPLLVVGSVKLGKLVMDREAPRKQEQLSPYDYPTLGAIRTSLVDPDTPLEAYHRVGSSGTHLKLVFSDEFNANGRLFYPHMDQFWEAVDMHYKATDDLEWYLPDMVTTANGTLRITMDAFSNHGLHYILAMVQLWNKMCLTEGYVEVLMRLPGSINMGGLWPGAWMLGNLARPGYGASTDGTWPYSYDGCDAGTTPGQLSLDGLLALSGQRLTLCNCANTHHPSPGKGRGAPELDIFEGNKWRDAKLATGAQSVQVAPFDIWRLPDYGFVAIQDANLTVMNLYLGSAFQESVLGLTVLNPRWFETVVKEGPPDPARYGNTTRGRAVPVWQDSEESLQFQTFLVEYQLLGKDPLDAFAQFYVGGQPTVRIQGGAFHPNGNVGWRYLPQEPMLLVFNLGLLHLWNYIDWARLQFPVHLDMDYVRVYQREGHELVTCDPKHHPTTQYIKRHWRAYYDTNLTRWEDAGYVRPRNRLTSKC